MILKTSLTTVFILLFLAGLQAQSGADSSVCEQHGFCCSNDPTPAGVMISHVHMKKEWMLSYRYMQMTMDGMNSSKENILASYSASSEYMQMGMHMLMLMYGMTDKLTLMGMFHYNSAYMKMSMKMGRSYHSHTMTSAGAGDIKLSALYALLKKTDAQLITSLGVNIPTGSIQLKGENNSSMYPGKRLPYAMQAGSGTFDLLPCLSYLYKREAIVLSAQAQATIRNGYNTLGYRLGNEVSANIWAAWQWLSFISTSLRLEGNHTAAISGGDKELDTYQEISANPANYGGQRIYGFIGSSLQLKNGALRKHKLTVEYGLPCYQRLNGYQMPYKSLINFAYALTI